MKTNILKTIFSLDLYFCSTNKQCKLHCPSTIPESWNINQDYHEQNIHVFFKKMASSA